MLRLHRLTLLFLACFLSLPTWAEFSLYAAPGCSPALVAESQKTIDAFNGIVKEEIGATLDEEVRVRLCPSNDCYIEDLRQEGGHDLSRAVQLSKTTKAVAIYNDFERIIIVRLSGSNDLWDTRQVIAHELTHMLQLHFSGRVGDKPNRWIREGMAAWMGAVVENRVNGGTGIGTERRSIWHLDRLNILGLTPKRLSANEIDDANLDRWLAWTKEKRQPQATSDLMMLTLAERLGDGIFPALRGYFECVGGFSFESTCFRKHFGLEQKTFYADYEAWLTQAIKDNGRIEIVSDEVDEAERLQVEKLYRERLGQFKARFGKDLPVSIRVYLHPDRDSMALSVAKTLGLNPSDAARRSSRDCWQRMVLHLNLGTLNTPERLAKSIKTSLASQYQFYLNSVGLNDSGQAAQ